MQASTISSPQSEGTRKSWDEAILRQALITLKTQNLRGTAATLGVTHHALRHALSREGVSVRAYRSIVAKKKRVAHHGAKATTFAGPSLGANRPFLAMTAFEERPANGCSWPIGDLEGDEFRFCGKPRASRRSYCLACAKLAYVGAPPLNLESYELI